MEQKIFDVIIIGGGQSGMAVGYYLRRTKLDYLILDDQQEAGGSWLQYWDSLRLFSPAQWSSLPGVIMPGGPDYYPTRNEAIDYLQNYEKRYAFPVERPVIVQEVVKENEHFLIHTNKGTFTSKVIVSASGSFRKPFVPAIPGKEKYKGKIIHSATYKNAESFKGKKVLVVGEGNSGAQILAEVSKVAETVWTTLQQPEFMPEEITGRMLFDFASAAYKARQEGKSYTPPSLGHIVRVPSVVEALGRNVYQAVPAFHEFTETGVRWENGQSQDFDGVIFCTGFRPALDHLEPLEVVENDGKVNTTGTQAKKVKGLWLVGYGSWTGFASATLIAVGRSAKQTVKEIQEFFDSRV